MFNLLLIDDWLIGLFGTNNDIWRFLEQLGKQLEAGEPVPKEIYVFTVSHMNLSSETHILETAKIVRTSLNIPSNDEEALTKEYFIYTAMHDDPETKRVALVVQKVFHQILKVLYEGETN